MTEPDAPLLSSIKGLRGSPANMRSILAELSRVLHADSAWSRAEIFRAGELRLDWKKASSIAGLWQSPPAMMTATLDRVSRIV